MDDRNGVAQQAGYIVRYVNLSTANFVSHHPMSFAPQCMQPNMKFSWLFNGTSWHWNTQRNCNESLTTVIIFHTGLPMMRAKAKWKKIWVK